MICKIADLLVEVPEADGLAVRCAPYRWEAEKNAQPQIVIQTSQYHPEVYPGVSGEMVAYIESGRLFHRMLPQFYGMMLHASAVAVEGGAYLFSAACGVGKSTHTILWKQMLGDRAVIFNDDKPSMRLLDETWYAYGTPWCGKDGINVNMRVPLAGICFLKQSDENRITRLSKKEAVFHLLEQTMHGLREKSVDRILTLLPQMIDRVPMFVLENRPELAAAELSYETMRGEWEKR